MNTQKYQTAFEAKELLYKTALAHRPFASQKEFDDLKKAREYTGTDPVLLAKKMAAFQFEADMRSLASEALNPDTTNKAARLLRQKVGSIQVGGGSITTIATFDVTVGDFDLDMGWMQIYQTVPGEAMIGGQVRILTTTKLFTAQKQTGNEKLNFSPIAKENFVTMDFEKWYVAIQPDTDWLNTNSYAKANDLFVKMRVTLEAKKAENLWGDFTADASLTGTESFATDYVTTINNAVVTLRARLADSGYKLSSTTPWVLAGNTKYMPQVMAALRTIELDTRQTNVVWPIVPVFSDYIPVEITDGGTANPALILTLPGRNHIYAPVKATIENVVADVETETTKMWVREAYAYDNLDANQSLKVRVS